MKQFSSVKEAVNDAFTSRRQSSGSIMHDVDDAKAKDVTLSIPTFCHDTQAKEIDISRYTPDEMERLRLEDPFLYYSIPATKRQLYESDTSSPVNSPARSNAKLCPTRRSSCPTILLTNNSAGDNDGKQQQQRRESVRRARRVSAEPHPSITMKRIMDEMNIDIDDEADSDMDEEDERLIQALANGTFDEEI